MLYHIPDPGNGHQTATFCTFLHHCTRLVPLCFVVRPFSRVHGIGDNNVRPGAEINCCAEIDIGCLSEYALLWLLRRLQYLDMRDKYGQHHQKGRRSRNRPSLRCRHFSLQNLTNKQSRQTQSQAQRNKRPLAELHSGTVASDSYLDPAPVLE